MTADVLAARPDKTKQKSTKIIDVTQSTQDYFILISSHLQLVSRDVKCSTTSKDCGDAEKQTAAEENVEE